MSYHSGGPINYTVNAAGVSVEWHGNRLLQELLSMKGEVRLTAYWNEENIYSNINI